jgi:hypothetical protein
MEYIMKYCPECKAEYKDEAMVCSDCNTLLVSSLPESRPMEECDTCGGEVELDSDFCPHCGTLFAEDQYSCTNHPTGVAAGVCVICQQVFCDKCLFKKNGRQFCKDHAAVEVSEGWAVVLKTHDYIEAEIIRGKLDSAGITTNRRNTGNIATLADGFIDNSLGRTIFKYPIKIYVPANQYTDALNIVNEKFLDGELDQH